MGLKQILATIGITTGVIFTGIMTYLGINYLSEEKKPEQKQPTAIVKEKEDDSLNKRLIKLEEESLKEKLEKIKKKYSEEPKIETTKTGKQNRNTHQIIAAGEIFNIKEFSYDNKYIIDMKRNVNLIVQLYKSNLNFDRSLAEFFKYDVYAEVRDSVKTYDDEKYQQITQKDCIKFNKKCETTGLYKLMKEIVEKNKHRGYLKTTETIEKTTETLTKEETLTTKPEKKTPVLPYEIQEKEYKKGGFVEIRKYNDCRMSLYVEYQKDSGTEKTEYFIKDNKTLTGFPIKNYNGKTTLENALIKIDAEDTAKACCGTLNDMVIDYYNNAKIINKVYTFEISNKAFKEYIKKAAIFNK